MEQRGGYYDQSGTLRDMVPNHIFQLISLTAMEPPISFQADAVRDEQAKTLHAIQPLSSEDVLSRAVRGQYGDGRADEKHMPAYRSETSVAPDSTTETFVAMRLQIDTGVGLMCRSTCAPESACRSGTPKSPYSSGALLLYFSAILPWSD